MFNYRLLLIVAILIASCATLGFMRLAIDTDVVRSLPVGERVMVDAVEIFAKHPIHDQIAVDIMIDRDDPDTLVECGALLEEQMRDSGLFAQVGIAAMGELVPRLAFHVARNLPLLFSGEELRDIAPLLVPERIDERLRRLHTELGSLEGIGQAEFIGLDPLGLKDLVLAKMALLAPSLQGGLYRGSLLSGDGRHLLVTARPLAAGTDTGSARAISEFFSQTAHEIAAHFAAKGVRVTMTPLGAYRAALDNERIIRHDVRLALALSAFGIALLLALAFSRPLVGLLSLVPALAGSAAALFVYSLFRSSISIIVLGFGGAIISITVDYGIAYLLFLDRPHETRGKTASREVKAIGLMAMITTTAAFLVLSVSGFPIFAELGVFTAMGVFFSFLFVHTVFPRIFPLMPPGRERALPLQSFVTILYGSGRRGAIAAALLACGLIFFARPHFEVSLSSMNTVSQDTEAADVLFSEVWGKIGERVFVLRSDDDIAAIQRSNDSFLAALEEDMRKEVLAAAFVPSMLFPGPERSARNLGAWREFWDSNRVAQVEQALGGAGVALGFTSDAFAPFLLSLAPEGAPRFSAIPAEFHGLLGIAADTDGGGLLQFITVVPGKNYDAEGFLSRYGGESKIFDAAFFSERLAGILFTTFTTMLAIIAGSVALLLFLVSLSLPLTIMILLPPAFAYICTLGTMNLMGRPLDIPALMLSIVILGMGIDYAIFCVRAHQRYRDISHPSYIRVRSGVFLSAFSTMIGFGVLCFAEHSLLRSIGVTSLLGIFYSLLGSFLLLPPLLGRYFSAENKRKSGGGRDLPQRVRDRFRTLEAYPRMFARFKLRYDPLFAELPGMLPAERDIRTIVDIGCGYGVPACWCLEKFKDARIIAMDPDPERVRVASLVLAERGRVTRGWAPDMPPVPGETADVVLLLDMLHYLDDATVTALFRNAFQALAPAGLLVARHTISPAARPSWSWRLEILRIRAAGQQAWCRSPERMVELLAGAGFTVTVNKITTNPELAWLVGRADKEAACATSFS